LDIDVVLGARPELVAIGEVVRCPEQFALALLLHSNPFSENDCKPPQTYLPHPKTHPSPHLIESHSTNMISLYHSPLPGEQKSNPIIILDTACTSYAIIHQSIHCSIPLYCVGAKKPTEVIDAIIETGGAGMLFFHRDDEKRKRLHIAI